MVGPRLRTSEVGFRPIVPSVFVMREPQMQSKFSLDVILCGGGGCDNKNELTSSFK